MNMKLFSSEILLALIVFFAGCTEDNSSSKQTLPKLDMCPNPWSSVTHGDVDGDAYVDEVFLGTCEPVGAVLVRFNSSGGEMHQQQLRFSIGADEQPAMCSADIKLVVQDRVSASFAESDSMPAGYDTCADCVEIKLIDDPCDPLQIYWNSKTETLAWWR
jgi:hypothetical protein